MDSIRESRGNPNYTPGESKKGLKSETTRKGELTKTGCISEDEDEDEDDDFWARKRKEM